MLGQRDAQEQDRAAQHLLHRDHRADGPPVADEDRGAAEAEAHRLADRVGQGAGGVAAVRVRAALGVDLDVRVGLLHEGPHEPADLLGRLVGHQAAGGEDLGPPRHDGLQPRACVTAGHAVHLEGRLRPHPLHHLEGVVGP